MTDLTVCFTGHRHLPPDKRNAVAASLIRAIAEAYSNGYRRFMCGGALGFDTIAAGDSYNDLDMILNSQAGFLFRSTERIKADYPQLPAFEEYDDLLAAIKKAIAEG